MLKPGEPVIRRYHKRGEQLSVVKFCRVVSDDERGLLLWLAEGSPLRWLRAADGRGLRDMPFAEWLTVPKQLVARRWTDTGVLILLPPDAAHSVWWFYRGPGGGFSQWYINLEQPAVRWSDGELVGVDTVDYDLDIVVMSDRSWCWKDEHELAERIAFPEHYWVSDPVAVRAEGERLAALAEAGGFPFDGTFCDFRPDPGWSVPAELPAGWDRPRAWS
ncbi:DUF402 domain-containing protein [Natronosporangium hydrolyticum]|uniref:DUF402 domain-containing protein n=1 Tax=Natronosporangium hydrolyticum TaxID=2811111 RepID=A0A895YH77_9ACTN|nr:DUF402 domain-containing protein [Natronosporangium hydrolyticum]QSB13520.1 DUF402 domain-containing protein [Natronosporangium hydrolyticum]